MHSTKIATSFIKNNNKLLILKISDKIRSIKSFWSRVSGITRKKNPVSRAKIEIFEKVGIIENKIIPRKSTEKIKIFSTYYENHELEYFHFYLKQNR